MGKKSKNVDQRVESSARLAEQAPESEEPGVETEIPPDSQEPEVVKVLTVDERRAIAADAIRAHEQLEEALAVALGARIEAEDALCRSVLARRGSLRNVEIKIGDKKYRPRLVKDDSSGTGVYRLSELKTAEAI